MASGQFGLVLREVQRLFSLGTVAGLSEGQLLERFVAEGDEVAFEAIVARHGPMVLGVCRRVLSDPNDVDDAFQATFLVLVRKAGSLRDRDLLANWLHGVAFRVAKRARASSARRLRHERRGETIEAAGPMVDTDPCERQPMLHEELDRLPEKYRVPIVLCYLEGQTHEEAARLLHWPVGTVKGRLSRAREMLRDRLTRRSLTLSGGALATSLTMDASAALPAALRDSTIQAALRVATGQGAVSATAAALTEGVIQAMFLTKLKVAAVGVLAIGTLATGAGVLARQAPRPDPGGGAAAKETVKLSVPEVPPHLAVAPTAQVPEGPMPKGVGPNAALADVRLKLAAGLFDASRNLYKDGTIEIEPFILASQRLRDCQEDVAETKEERIAAAAAHLDRMNELARGVKPRIEAGTATSLTAKMAAFARADAEFRLAELKAGRGEAEGGNMDRGAIGGGGGEDLGPPLEDGQDPRSKAVLAKLESVVSMPFAEDTPIEDAIKYIQTATSDMAMPAGIPVYIDPQGLEAAEKTIQSPIKLALEGVPLRRSLKLLLGQLGLKYVVKDGLLMISTHEGLQDLIADDRPPVK